MTTEFVVLLSIVLFVLVGVFINGDTGIRATFEKSAPILARRVEKHIETGESFAKATYSLNDPISWSRPNGKPGRPLR